MEAWLKALELEIHAPWRNGCHTKFEKGLASGDLCLSGDSGAHDRGHTWHPKLN